MGFKDNMQVTDHVSVTLETKPTNPKYPCPLCGAETKEAQPIEDKEGNIIERRRICSKKECRNIIRAN